MKKLALFIGTCFTLMYVSGQKTGQAYIDSAVPILRTATDTNRVILYHGIANAYVHIDPARARAYVDSGLAAADKIKWEKGKAVLLLVEGNLLNDAGKGEEAMRVYDKAMKIVKRLGDQGLIARSMNDIGGAYLRSSDYTKAMEWYARCLKMAETLDDPDMRGTALTNMSTIAYNQQDYQKAVAYNEQAMQYFRKLGNPDKIARTFNYIGNSYFALGKMPEAERQFNEALKIYKETNNRTGIAILYSQIAILFDPDYRKIIDYQLRSQAIWDSINPMHYNSIINLGNIGETYLNVVRADTGQLRATLRGAYLDTAAIYLNRAIAYSRQTNDLDNLSYFTQILAEQQALKGDYKSALASYQYGYGLRDSLFSQQNKNTIAGIESRREIELRDKQIQVNAMELRGQRRLQVALAAGLALLAIIAFLILRQSRQRKRTNTTLLQLNNELDEANKVKAKFFAILSHDLRSPVANLISFLELQQQQPDLLSAESAIAHQKKIVESAHGLLENMEAMLLWSKGQMEAFKPQLKAVRVSELFTYLQSFFADAGVSLKFQDPGNIEVVTDENYLKTIMHNLTANAIKVLRDNPAGYVEWRVKRQGSETIISVSDNGPGMSEDQAKALYEDTAVPNTRTGFGLHLVRDLAKAIHCRISMDSAPGQGTTFVLSA